MNLKLKSMCYAFRAEDIEIFTSEEDENFIASHLICSQCKALWYTDLAECYLCGELNYNVYVCKKNHYTSQQSSTKECGKSNCHEQVEKKCINKKCPSNTSKIIKDISEKKRDEGKRGVFERGESSWRTSQLHCIKCGGAENIYNQFLIYVEDYDEKTLADILTKHHGKDDHVVIFKKKLQVLKSSLGFRANTQYASYRSNEDMEEWKPAWKKLPPVINELFS